MKRLGISDASKNSALGSQGTFINSHSPLTQLAIVRTITAKHHFAILEHEQRPQILFRIMTLRTTLKGARVGHLGNFQSRFASTCKYRGMEHYLMICLSQLHISRWYAFGSSISVRTEVDVCGLGIIEHIRLGISRWTSRSAVGLPGISGAP